MGRTGRDSLDTATAGETTDSRLGNALDVVTKNLAVALGAALAEALATLAACRVPSVAVPSPGRCTILYRGTCGDCHMPHWCLYVRPVIVMWCFLGVEVYYGWVHED